MRALDPSKSFVMIRSSTSRHALAFPKNSIKCNKRYIIANIVVYKNPK